MTAVNLIPAARRDAHRRRVVVRRWTVACMVYALALAAAWGAIHAVHADSAPDPGLALRDVETRIQHTQAELTALRTRLGAARRTLHANQAVSDQPDFSLLLALLAHTVEDQVVLRRCRLGPVSALAVPSTVASKAVAPAEAGPGESSRLGVILHGVAPSQPDVTQFVVRLERTGLFAHVDLLRTSREPSGTLQAIAFELYGELDGSEAEPP